MNISGNTVSTWSNIWYLGSLGLAVQTMQILYLNSCIAVSWSLSDQIVWKAELLKHKTSPLRCVQTPDLVRGIYLLINLLTTYSNMNDEIIANKLALFDLAIIQYLSLQKSGGKYGRYTSCLDLDFSNYKDQIYSYAPNYYKSFI